MKFSDGYAFPHPVLGMNDDIDGQAQMEITYDQDSDPDNYILTIKFDLANPDLSALLAESKVQFVSELNCSATLYRKAELTSALTQTIKLSKTFVRDDVKLLCLLVAAEPIPAYTNSKAHSDFDGYTFSIDQGDVLAFLGETSFFAGISYLKLTAVSSFLEIISGENETGDFNIILDESKIQIQLSKKDFQTYQVSAISQSKEYASTFHSSLVLPSLIHALYQLGDPVKSDLDDTAWAKIIRYRLEFDEKLRGLSLESDYILKITQILLGMPLERLLADLYTKATADADD